VSKVNEAKRRVQDRKTGKLTPHSARVVGPGSH